MKQLRLRVQFIQEKNKDSQGEGTMGIQKLELFHSAVLSKIIRNKKKISLIEWEEKENRALYRIETEINIAHSIFIKYNAKERKRNHDLAWLYDFGASCLFNKFGVVYRGVDA